MKKIIFSTAMIAAVAAIVIGATTAFFSDVETSEDNTFAAGSLDLKFQVDNRPGQWTDVDGNPLFDGVSFPLNDLKPGDNGERTVRLWVEDNPACGQVIIDVTEDKDNSCTEPELVDEPGCVATTTGELNDQVQFMVWEDDCNNIFEPDKSETILISGPLTGDKEYWIGALPEEEGQAQCYGIAYCFGSWVGGKCDGSGVNNSAQTDSFKADLIINALQQRHQFPDGCPIGEKNGQIPV